MKKISMFLITVGMAFTVACSGGKSEDERYVYEGDKIVDEVTGDEYYMEEDDVITVKHADGTTEKLAIDETPFYESALSEEYIQSLEARYFERKESLLAEKKEKLKEARRSRYAEFSDDELLERFRQAHKDGLDMTRQMDMMAELVERDIVSDEEAPDLLEIDPKMMDLEIELEEPIEEVEN
jgi:serine phosphatase RsbU (regulator of sigma subunit)